MRSFLRIGQKAFLVAMAVSGSLLFSVTSVAEPAKGRNLLQAVQDRHRDRFREFSKQIEKLAEFCDEKNLAEGAQQVRSRAIVPEAQALRVDKLPSEHREEIPPALVGDERQWRTIWSVSNCFT